MVSMWVWYVCMYKGHAPWINYVIITYRWLVIKNIKTWIIHYYPYMANQPPAKLHIWQAYLSWRFCSKVNKIFWNYIYIKTRKYKSTKAVAFPVELARKHSVTRLCQIHFRLALKTVVRHWIADWGIFSYVWENFDRLSKAKQSRKISVFQYSIQFN